MSLNDSFKRWNGAVGAVLRSPLHWPLSLALAVATVTGRRSGVRYSFPVGYQRVRGGLVIMVSQAREKQWWRNYLEGGPIELLVRGRTLHGQARVLDPASDEFRARTEQTLRRMPWMGKQFKVAYRKGELLSDEQVKQLGSEIAAVHVDIADEVGDGFWYAFRPVDMDFLDAAPAKYVVEREIGAPRMQVWGAFSDPTTWPEWWPGVESASYPDQDPPHGVGTRRVARVKGQMMDETMVAWDEGRLWAYFIRRSTAPLAHAQLEATEFEDRADGTRTLVRWTLASDPRLMLKLATPLMQPMLERLLERALRNLETYLASRPIS